MARGRFAGHPAVPGTFALHEAPPDHSTLSRTRRLIDVETHQAVFTWVLQRLADAHLVEGHTIGNRRDDARSQRGDAEHRASGHGRGVRGVVDSARRSVWHRDANAGRVGAVRSETEEEGVERGLDASARSRCEDHEDEDGRTHLAHTAEHAVDLETGAIVGVTVQDADAGDTTTMVDTLIESGGSSRRGGRRFGNRRGRGRQGVSQPTRRWLGLRISASGAMCRSLIAVGASGRARRQPRKRCMPTGGGFEGIVDNACCGSAANGWNGPTRIATRPGHAPGASARPSQYPQTPASCTSVASTSGCSCGS